MEKLFNLNEYRKYLEEYYKYPCDKDKVLERKQAIDRYSDEYLQNIIDNTLEFIKYLINKMRQENKIFEGKRFTHIETSEYNKYISNNSTGGWHADTLHCIVEFKPDFYISYHLLSSFLGPDSSIHEDERIIDNDSEYFDDILEIGSISYIPMLVISIPNERFSKIEEKLSFKNINNLRVNKINEMIMKYKLDSNFSSKEISDGHHTFRELYHHRIVMFATICNLFSDISWKSKKHYDEENDPMYNGSFIVGINTPDGMATYHIKLEYWDMFNIPEIDRAPKYDGEYSSDDVIKRIYSLSKK